MAALFGQPVVVGVAVRFAVRHEALQRRDVDLFVALAHAGDELAILVVIATDVLQDVSARVACLLRNPAAIAPHRDRRGDVLGAQLVGLAIYLASGLHQDAGARKAGIGGGVRLHAAHGRPLKVVALGVVAAVVAQAEDAHAHVVLTLGHIRRHRGALADVQLVAGERLRGQGGPDAGTGRCVLHLHRLGHVVLLARGAHAAQHVFQVDLDTHGVCAGGAGHEVGRIRQLATVGGVHVAVERDSFIRHLAVAGVVDAHALVARQRRAGIGERADAANADAWREHHADVLVVALVEGVGLAGEVGGDRHAAEQQANRLVGAQPIPRRCQAVHRARGTRAGWTLDLRTQHLVDHQRASHEYCRRGDATPCGRNGTAGTRNAEGEIRQRNHRHDVQGVSADRPSHLNDLAILWIDVGPKMPRHDAPTDRHRPVALVQVDHVPMQEVAQALARLQVHRNVALPFQGDRVRRQHQLAFARRRGHQTHV